MLAVPPRSIQHPDYGFSVGRGAWRFETGKWTTVAERVRMNAVGVAKVDGLFEKALRSLGVEAREVVMVGDSWDRDVVPAGKARIRCVWYAEGSGEDS